MKQIYFTLVLKLKLYLLNENNSPTFIVVFCGSLYAQTTITGSVMDDNGQPIPGANIIVVGTPLEQSQTLMETSP